MIHNGTVPRVDEKKLKYVNFVEDYSIVKVMNDTRVLSLARR